ncbi:MAG TPA: hypothetical protein VE974_13315 [Thermoanaerobaculia bacterium]|nr:hypothetical protein [Thermoanaerobaculia bacterium]
MIRSFRIPALIVYLFFSLVAAAQSVSIFPAGPTTRTPIYVSALVQRCDEPQSSVQVVGSVIKVHFDNRTFCDPPFSDFYTARIPGLLPAGEYRLEVSTNTTAATVTTFIVRNAEPQAFTAHPFAVPATQLAPIKVRLVSPEPLCTPNSTACRVSVDGVEALDERVDEEGHVWFTAPQHAPGLANVTIDNGPRAVTVPNALYYFSLNAAPDISIFERILFPMLTEVSGVNGSLFRTEVAISNPKRWFVETFNEIVPFVCIDYPCGNRLSPGELVKFSGGDYPRGVALLTPRDAAPELAFALRARDVSRQAEGYGTEIPVVRESEMYVSRPIALLGVPVSSGYRAKLRIYSFSPGAASVRVQNGTGVLVELKRTCSGKSCASTPWYGEYDLPAGTAPRVNVFVEAIGPAWAFITVTNNETQQITTITPQGKGGR